MPLPAQSDLIVDVPATEGGAGFRQSPNVVSTCNSAGLTESFPGSPIIGQHASMDDESIKKEFVELVLRGPVKNKDGKPSRGYCFSSFNRDYDNNGAPSYVGIGYTIWQKYRDNKLPPSAPANAFMPNPSSIKDSSDDSGVNLNPAEKTIVPARFVENDSRLAPRFSPLYGGSAFVGEGTALSPDNASIRLVSRGELVMGKSAVVQPGALTHEDPVG